MTIIVIHNFCLFRNSVHCKNPTFNDDNDTKGVLFCGYKPVPVKIVMNRIRNPITGEITHFVYDDTCQKVTKKGTKIVADYSTIYSVYYDAGLFETNKFGVGLKNRILKSVNSESTPKIKVAVKALATLVGTITDLMPLTNVPSAGKIACSANK